MVDSKIAFGKLTKRNESKNLNELSEKEIQENPLLANLTCQMAKEAINAAENEKYDHYFKETDGGRKKGLYEKQ